MRDGVGSAFRDFAQYGPCGAEPVWQVTGKVASDRPLPFLGQGEVGEPEKHMSYLRPAAPILGNFRLRVAVVGDFIADHMQEAAALIHFRANGRHDPS